MISLQSLLMLYINKIHDSYVFVFGKKIPDSDMWQFKKQFTYRDKLGKLHGERLNKAIIDILKRKLFIKNSTKINEKFWTE